MTMHRKWNVYLYLLRENVKFCNYTPVMNVFYETDTKLRIAIVLLNLNKSSGLTKEYS